MKGIKILITGKPGVGKSTLLTELITEIQRSKKGFVTKEMRDSLQNRCGFMMENSDGKSEIIASTMAQTPTNSGKYYVNIPKIEKIISGLTFSNADLLYIDELAPIQLCSPKFLELAKLWLDSPNDMIALIKEDHNAIENETIKTFIIEAKSQYRVIELTRDTYDAVKSELLEIFQK
jgi:nucleoside-triphosphatase